MHIINYKKGYIPKFDCVIHGTLVMTKKEFKQEMLFIKRHTISHTRYNEALTQNYIINKKGEQFYCFGVTPTKKLAQKHSLKNYKDQNYQIKVI